MKNWKSKFQNVDRIDRSTRFSTYRAEKNNEYFFVKESNKSTHEWSRKSIDKEYEIYKNLHMPDFTVPSIEMYREGELLCIDWIDNYSWHSDNFSERDYISNIMNSYQKLLKNIRRNNISIQTRWPNQEEFYHRMDAEVNFNPDKFTEVFPILKSAKITIQNRIKNSNIRKTFVHGDLFYPNVMHCSGGKVKSVIDWEISGIFDNMYDVAFIEATHLEIIPKYTDTYSKSDILRIFRNKLNLTDAEIERVKLYKLWPYYVNMAAFDSTDKLPDYSPFSTKREAVKYFYNLFIDTLDKSVLDKKPPKSEEVLNSN
jgi:thiamine kinase-like enzyme